ncbi:MAG TPA: PDZ domain-containing protein, partial [Alphaproteobacteria bacterium]|nr:PDZ domain-containing protein [Alphaproteobacteria bacterium]
PGGPAEQAGLRGGDTIVAVAGRPIENIYDYTYALDELSVGEPVVITVMRAGRRVELPVTPISRD